jgi:hypothetical protein
MPSVPGRLAVFVLLTGAVWLMFAAGAGADRKPTAKERQLIAKVAKLPPECANVRISTVTARPVWGSVTFKPGATGCKQFASDGVTVVKRIRKGTKRRWHFVTAGSSFSCSELYADVPRQVAQDLGIDCF